MKTLQRFFITVFVATLWNCTPQKNNETTTTGTDDSLNNSQPQAAIAPSGQVKQTAVKYYLEDLLACQTLEGIQKKYGEANVKKSMVVPGPEGTELTATVLFADTEDAIEIYWNEGKEFKEIESVICKATYARDERMSFGSAWASRMGIRLGTRLSEVVKQNNKPFQISGFSWDYGGRVTSWEGGNLENKGLHLRFTENNPEVKLSETEQNSISGEADLLVSLPTIQKLNPRVDEITLSNRRKAVQ
jgi:hypothetical protein